MTSKSSKVLKNSKRITVNEAKIKVYQDKTKQEYLEKKKKIEAENTFKPAINKKTKAICKDRYTIEKSPDGKEKVKSILF